jgi:cell division protein FtsL
MGNTEAKTELLEDLDQEQKKAKNISAHTLVWTFIILFFVLLFILPKIYIANQIYYISKDINTKYHKYTALLEEKRYLQKKIEELQYQSQVVDDIDMP